MRIFLAAAVALVLFISNRAEACSCSFPTAPFDNARGLPLNAQLMLPLFFDDSTATLVGPNGETVECDLATTTTSLTLRPKQPLPPETRFTVQHSGRTAAFETGTSMDTTPPVAPTLGAFSFHARDLLASGGTCDIGGEDFTVEFVNHAEEPVIFEVFAGPSASSIDLTTPALVIDPRGQSSFRFGDKGLCNPRFAVSKAADLAIQVRAVDFAGNASELSNALQLKTGGCSATGGTALILLSALFLRRRRS